jgi:hypothetical protein
LKPQIVLEILSNLRNDNSSAIEDTRKAKHLANEALKRQFADQEIGRLLVPPGEDNTNVSLWNYEKRFKRLHT